MRVLVADDEKAIGVLISAVLRTLGYKFQIVHDGREALDAIEKEPPFDLIISDIQMPNMDGITMIRRIKLIHPATPILLITAYSDLCTQGKIAGADWCLEKPFSYFDLLHAVEEVMKTSA